MPASVVVVLGRLVQAETAVLQWADPFGRVDDAALQRREDVAAAKAFHVDADGLIDLAAEARDAHFQALEVGQTFDRLLEPARHLDAGIAARHADNAEVVVNLVPKF